MMSDLKASVPLRLSVEPIVLMGPHRGGNSGVCGGGGGRGARLITGLQLGVLHEDPGHVVEALALLLLVVVVVVVVVVVSNN